MGFGGEKLSDPLLMRQGKFRERGHKNIIDFIKIRDEIVSGKIKNPTIWHWCDYLHGIVDKSLYDGGFDDVAQAILQYCIELGFEFERKNNRLSTIGESQKMVKEFFEENSSNWEFWDQFDFKLKDIIWNRYIIPNMK